MTSDTDALTQGEVFGERDHFFKRGLPHQRRSEVVAGVVTVVVEQPDLVEDVRFKQMRLIDDENGLYLLLRVKFHNGAKDLTGDIGLSELGDNREFTCDL